MKIGPVEEMFVFRVFLDETLKRIFIPQWGLSFFLVQLSNHKIPQCYFRRGRGGAGRGEAAQGGAERGGAGRSAAGRGEAGRSGAGDAGWAGSGCAGRAAACSQSRNSLLETVPEQGAAPRSAFPVQA